MFEALSLPTPASVYYEFMDLNWIYVQKNRVVIESFNSLSENTETEIKKGSFAQNKIMFEEFSNSKTVLFPPEFLDDKKPNSSTLVWILGNVIYFIFEVF